VKCPKVDTFLPTIERAIRQYSFLLWYGGFLGKGEERELRESEKGNDDACGKRNFFALALSLSPSPACMFVLDVMHVRFRAKAKII